MRKIRDSVYGEIPSKPVSIESGGTNGNNSISAINALGGFHKSSIDKPGGPLGLTTSEQISPDVLDNNDLNVEVCLKGSDALNFLATGVFTITNYDIAKTYTVQAIGAGSVSINGNSISYIAPGSKTTGGDGFRVLQKKGTVNLPTRSVYMELDITGSVNKPTITAPTNKKTNVATEYTFTSSVFGYTGSTQMHLGSEWELSDDVNFTSLIFSTVDDAVNKASWMPGILEPMTVYYIRVRYKGSSTGYSLWSNTIQFTTGIDYPKTLRQQLRHSDPEQGDLFGWNVVLSGDNTTLAVAAPNKLNSNIDMSQFGASDFVESFETVASYINDARNWFGAVSMYGNIYACAYGTGIDNGAVVAFNEISGSYLGVSGSTNSRTGIATRKDTQGTAVELWECGTGFIGSWHNGMADFYSHPGIPSYQFRGICTIGDDIYLCVYNGVIYSFNRPDTDSDRVLAVFHNETAAWTGVYDINGTLYATTYGAGGQIFKFEGNVSGGKTLVTSQTGYWTGLVYHRGVVFACTGQASGRLYYQSKSTGDFVSIQEFAVDTVWNGMFIGNDNICAVQSNGYIYKVPWNTKGIMGGLYAGAVYVFKKVGATWTQQVKLIPDDSLGWDCFGCSISMSHDGNTLLAWSPRRYTFTESNSEWHLQYQNQGKAYVFQRTGEIWSQEAIIDRPEPKRQVLAKISSSAFFGSDGALWNCTAINEAGTVLAIAYSWELFSGDANTGIRKGYVYIYEKIDNTWTHRDTITIEDQSTAAQSLSNTNLCPVLNAAGDVLYLGVPGYDRTINGELQQCAGKVDIYTYNGSTWDKSLFPVLMTESNGSLYFHAAFGIMVKVNIDESKMFVTTGGSYGENIYRTFVFEKNESNQWIQTRRLGWGTSLDHSPKIDIDERGYTASAGLPFIDLNGEGQAEVYKNRVDDWSLDYTLYQINSGAATIEGDLFGYSTALNSSGDTLFIGSPGNNMTSPARDNVGKVYIYSK